MDAPSAGKAAADLVLAAADIPSIEPPTSTIGQIWAGITFAVLSFFGVVATLYSFRSGFKSAHRPERTRIEALSLTDNDALAQKLAQEVVGYLSQPIKGILDGAANRDRNILMLSTKVDHIDRQIEHLTEQVQHIITEQEIAKRAREEVARQLADRDRGWHPRGGE